MFEEVCKYRPCAEGKTGNVSRWGTSLGQAPPQQQQYHQQAKGGADSKMQVDDDQSKSAPCVMGLIAA
jgi:hypothetical protein